MGLRRLVLSCNELLVLEVGIYLGQTYTASAAPARMLLDTEKHLAPFPLPTITRTLLLGTFKHRNLGREAQFLREVTDDSAEVAARTALCALMVILVNKEFPTQLHPYIFRLSRCKVNPAHE